MSWRDIARAVRIGDSLAVGEEQFGNNDNFAEPLAHSDAIEESEAISIIDGGLPPAWATALSMLERSPRPHAISEKDWRSRLDAIWRRADLHGAEFAENGWTFKEVFGVGAHWARLDRRGAAWFAPECQVVEITPERVVFERAGRRSTHTKPIRIH